jgi:4-phosphopantoate--beta-alanine ligase
MDEDTVPESHPRAESLEVRHRLEDGIDSGITSRQGLLAHGRGEAFDYLIGERTIDSADRAERAAAAHLLQAEHPVLSVNGNAAALVPDELVALADATEALLEVNLFNRTDERMRAIVEHLESHGAEDVLGLAGDGEIPGLDHPRATVDADGIGAADVVLVPLEDGDRAEALAALEKTLIVIDLNPLSRSSVAADVPIVDNVVRAIPRIAEHARDLVGDPEAQRSAIADFDADAARDDAERAIRGGDLA